MTTAARQAMSEMLRAQMGTYEAGKVAAFPQKTFEPRPVAATKPGEESKMSALGSLLMQAVYADDHLVFYWVLDHFDLTPESLARAMSAASVLGRFEMLDALLGFAGDLPFSRDEQESFLRDAVVGNKSRTAEILRRRFYAGEPPRRDFVETLVARLGKQGNTAGQRWLRENFLR